VRGQNSKIMLASEEHSLPVKGRGRVHEDIERNTASEGYSQSVKGRGRDKLRQWQR
jgi:hypothetical protein